MTEREKFINSSEFIEDQSKIYDVKAANNSLFEFKEHEEVNEYLSKDDMVKLYDKKFVAHAATREKYYDKIIGVSKSGICPICGIGQVSTLDHYLAKTLYPTFAVTPDNLVPMCFECNKTKHSMPIDNSITTPMHPYYDDIDRFIWLNTDVDVIDGQPIAKYYINNELKICDEDLYNRLCKHFEYFKLNKSFAIQAASEIANNKMLWKENYANDKIGFIKYINQCLKSYESQQKNTWKTALFRGLIKYCETHDTIPFLQ